MRKQVESEHGEILQLATAEERIRAMREVVQTSNVYLVKIEIKEVVFGGLPKNPELIKDWLLRRADAKYAADKPPMPADVLSTEQFAEQIASELAQPTEERGWSGFKGDAHGVYLEERQIKALIREGAVQRQITREWGFREALAHGVTINPARIRLFREDRIVREPDGYYESVGHVMTRQGPRDTLNRHDYVARPYIEFCLVNVNGGTDPLPREDELLAALITGENIGLGASRSTGVGKYRLVDFRRLDRNEYSVWQQLYQQKVAEAEESPKVLLSDLAEWSPAEELVGI